MKRNKSQIKVFVAFLVLLISSILVYNTLSYANTSMGQFTGFEINPKYLEWEQLSEEEKTNTIMPKPYTITVKNSVKRSTYNKLIKLETSTVGASYDLRDELEKIIVKDQAYTGDCWAFSTTSMIETSISQQYNKESTEFSPMHVEYYVSNNFKKNVGDGANAYIADAYLASGMGPVYESKLPFSSVYDEEENPASNSYLKDLEDVNINLTPDAQLVQSKYFASIYKTYSSTKEPIYTDAYDNQYTEAEVLALRELIKEHIKNYGGVAAGYHAPEDEDEYIKFFNEETSAYFCNDTSLNSNHQITIVGWDDNYNQNKDKFNADNQPFNDGAWIVLNSWGEEFGEDGYLYISYDDCRIEELIIGIVDINEVTEEPLGYDKIYQYDILGSTYPIGVNTTSAYAANVFTRNDTTKDEYLTKVGLFIDYTEGVEIYVNSEDDDFSNIISDENKVTTLTGTDALIPGYHLIDINPVKLTGNKFVVVAKYIHADGPVISLECNWTDSGLTYYSNYYDTATANAGESFISTNGTTWQDINGTRLSYTATLANTNACIKAFTTEQEAPATIAVTGVTLDKTEATLEIDETLALTATITPTDATNKNVSWSSSDTNIATVSESGIITAVSAGTATITVTTEDGNKTATCTITVEEPEPETIAVTGVALNKTTAELEIGETVQLIATITPTDATNKNVSWSSLDTNIATVSESGVVTAVSVGTTTITVTTVDGNKTATCTINVNDSTPVEPDQPDEPVEPDEPTEIPVTGVTLNKTQATMEIDETLSLVPTITPANATNKNVSWLSSNTNVATVNGGVVTAVSAGTTTITVTTVDGNKTATCAITVEEPEPETIAVTGVTLNKTSGTVKVGETLQLVATVTPATATNKDLTWTSSDNTVATVRGGVVTGISAGTATIIVTTVDGNKTATCQVTVEEDPQIIPVTSVSLNVSTLELQVGDESTLIATLNPTDATNKFVTWSSSDSSVVAVSATGVITAKKEGTATVTVTTEDGSFTDSVEITVTEKTNNDDDIYTDPDDGKDDDDTVKPGTLPETGEKLLIVGLIITVLMIGTICVIKFKKYNLK